ncbi:hypothetical protein B0920_22050 [Massilia sp. KIM]|uniref:DUF4175 family protein n=1 Tax=Massilia sp. KIM TaxID=1955422 RepID=UPI00098FB4EF|nr:DUF4175 family protein [Massilia sp. KIM]OON59957.1 hypothetical protein B0920_22050 [Massilia sp. KIM]
MQEGAEIVRRVWRAAQLRRLPLWLGGALPWLAVPSGPGLLAWAGWCAWDWAKLRRQVGFGWSAWLDGALPEMEDSSALLVRAETPVAQLQQRRLLDRLDASVTPSQLRAIARERLPAGYPVIALSAVLAAMVWYAGRATPQAPGQPAQPLAAAVAAPLSPLTVHYAPPGYTGVAPAEVAPRDLQLPEQTEVSWCLKDGADNSDKIELGNGQTLTPGKDCARWLATESVVWRWRGQRYTLRVIPDQPPEITVTAPTQMVVELPDTANSAAMAVKIADDYVVKRATLHMTLARGSGENIRFTDREMPIPGGSDPKLRNWSKQWSLAELGMEPGDELYFFVRATDNAGRPHTVQSPTYTLRLPAPDAEAEEESAAMPMLVKPQSLRSQRQIIIDTEQLVADMRSTKMSEQEVRDRSQKIAGDQGMLRRRYGQFLGEESSLFADEEEHDDHGGDHGGGEKQDILHQFGHAHDEAENATLFDEETKKVLRRALSAMWDAEKSLRAIEPKTALPPEHKALEAIKELQQAERVYLHKTAFTPPPIKEEKRMTGDMAGTASYRRVQADPDKPVPDEVRALVKALSGEAPLPALWTRTAHDWVRERLKDDEQRLAAQRAIQDVADGCAACRPVLRAWLRAGAGQGQVLLQARPSVETPFVRGWREGSAP